MLNPLGLSGEPQTGSLAARLVFPLFVGEASRIWSDTCGLNAEIDIRNKLGVTVLS